MIDKLYYLFIKTKYCEFVKDDLLNLKKFHERTHAAGLNAGMISEIKKLAIEEGLLGQKLSGEKRHIDNQILKNPLIMSSFVEMELFRLEENNLKPLAESIQEIKSNILKGLDSDGLKKAFELGLT